MIQANYQVSSPWWDHTPIFWEGRDHCGGDVTWATTVERERERESWVHTLARFMMRCNAPLLTGPVIPVVDQCCLWCR